MATIFRSVSGAARTPLMLGGIVLILTAVLLLNLSPRRRAVRSAGRTTI